jgi:hypothetical protein
MVIIAAEPIQATVGMVSDIEIISNEFPTGLSGYTIECSIDDLLVAKFADPTPVEFPDWDGLTSFRDRSNQPGREDDYVKISVADLIDSIKESDDSDGGELLATLKVEGVGVGVATVALNVTRLDDERGNDIIRTSVPGKVRVGVANFTSVDISQQIENDDGTRTLVIRFLEGDFNNVLREDSSGRLRTVNQYTPTAVVQRPIAHFRNVEGITSHKLEGPNDEFVRITLDSQPSESDQDILLNSLLSKDTARTPQNR